MPHRSQIPVLASPFAKDEGPWQEGVEEGVPEGGLRPTTDDSLLKPKSCHLAGMLLRSALALQLIASTG